MPRQAATVQQVPPSAAASGDSGVSASHAPASSPGEVSRLAAHLQGLALAEGTATGWCVALKPPKSVQLVVLDCAAGGQWAETTADAWLQRVLLNQGWSGWVCYNDETPAGSTASGTKFAHAKGILAWRKDRIGWLIHSVPAWPEAMSNEALPPLVASGQRCGQSFLFLSLLRTGDTLRRVCDQVRLMDACCYAGRVPPDEEAHVPFREDRWGEHLTTPYKLQSPSLVPLGPGVWHLAKDAAWGKMWVDGRPTDLDFYEDGLARTQPFEGFWHVQSWLNGNCPPFGRTQHCDNILQIRLPDGRPYETQKDHAKWAVHRDKPLVLVGDLNRTQTQAKRGGGGVILEDEGLWRALTSVVHQVGADHPPPPLPPPLSSYDEFHSTGLSGGVGRAGAGRLLQAQAGAARTAAPLSQRGQRRVSTAATRQGAAKGDGSEPDSGSGSESQAGSIQSSSTAGASTCGGGKGCNCKKGCSHGRCGCKRAGQPCGAHCGCKGNCANRAEAAASADAAAPIAAERAEECTAGTAGQAAALPPPEVAAAAIAAAMEKLAAASAAAAAVSALAPAEQLPGAEQTAAAAAVQQSPHAGPAAAAAASSSLAAGSDSPGGSHAASKPPGQQVQEAVSAAEQRCSCQKGCRDKRCPCRKDGRPCSEQCRCQGCTNCQTAAGGTSTGGGGETPSQPDGCVVC